MAKNAYTGEQSLIVGGKVRTLVFDWTAIARAQDELGASVLVKVGKIGALSPQEIAKLLAIGFERKHPELDEDAIMEASPVIMDALLAIDNALTHAYFGPSGKKEPAKGVTAKAVKDAKKKTS